MQRRVNDKPVEFSIEFCKKSTGELVVYPKVVLTSMHAKGSTINVLIVGESKPKKIRRCLITKFNQIKVYP